MQYSLVTQWHLDAPIEQVWAALIASDDWPKWWRFVKEVVEIKKGDAHGLDSVRQFTWTSRLPYRLRFAVRVKVMEKPHWMEGIASGDLNGTGSWKLEKIEGSTRVTYRWTVSTEKAWMNLLAPLLAPVFAWNHDQVMLEGGKGLARHLGVSLLNFQGSKHPYNPC
ncbi:MAG: polyketide cyclase [Methylococcaceae bacterium]|nr:polyketide cyclase [Methylococcaceae bacterium]